MSYLKHKVYGLIFRLFRHTTVEKNRISFIIDSRESFKGNLDYIKKEFEKRGNYHLKGIYRGLFSEAGIPMLTTINSVLLSANDIRYIVYIIYIIISIIYIVILQFIWYNCVVNISM